VRFQALVALPDINHTRVTEAVTHEGSGDKWLSLKPLRGTSDKKTCVE
jgi:hypothetical protein